MKYFFACCLLCCALIRLDAQNAAANPLSIGRILELDSRVLGEKRVLNLYIPASYAASDTSRYPVLYLLDGSANEDFLHIVGLLQFFNLMLGMPETLVVGIANVDRKRDFTHPSSLAEEKQKLPSSGGSPAFIDFLATELKPFIRQQYRTNGYDMLLGQSLGGLLATEVLLKKPGLFTQYFIVSPSLWWSSKELLLSAPALLDKQAELHTRVYLSVGKEGKVMEKDARHLLRILKKSGKKGLQTDFVYMPKENHATILHQSIYEALKLLYPYQQ